MIAKAERISNPEQDKLYHKRSCNDKSKRNSWRTSSSKERSYSKSRSRSLSRSREQTEKYSTHYSAQSKRQKQMYQRPKENDDHYQQATHMSSSIHVKNWKKDKDDNREYKTELSSFELMENNADRISNMNEIAKNGNTHILSEAEMNKLGARIIKAEIMGDEVFFVILLSTSFLISYDFIVIRTIVFL